MNIKEIEARSGMTRANIRYYEKEWLLKCQRKDNGYRDYTEENLEQLKKIHLLRELGCSLEQIHSLQQNPEYLASFMLQHAKEIENQANRLGNAGTVCEEISSEGVTYRQMNADRYLQRLEELSKEQRKTDYNMARLSYPAGIREDEEIQKPHPWKRFFARSLDYALYEFILSVIWEGLLHQMTADTFLYSCGRVILVITLTMALEPVLLHFFGTTFGKWILGIHLTDSDGVHLRYQTARRRTLQVIWRGEAFHIPIADLICCLRSRKKYVEQGKTDWDIEYDVEYQFRNRKTWICAGAWMAATAVMAFFTLLLDEYQYIPPNRGKLTVEKFAENYNWYVKKLSLVNKTTADSSDYLTEQAVYPPREEKTGVIVIELTANGHVKPQFLFETEGDFITAVTYTGTHTLKPKEWFSGYYPENIYTFLALAGAQEEISIWNFGFRQVIGKLDALNAENILNSCELNAAGLHLTNRVTYKNRNLCYINGMGVFNSGSLTDAEFTIQFRAEVK